MRVARFSFRVRSRACDNFGAVDYTVTETITALADGLLVESHATGVCEGVRVNEHESKHWPGARLDGAIAYRLANGYTRLA